MSLAFLVTVMTSPASARPVSNITIVNKTGGPIYNLKHLVADDVKDVFFAGKLDNGAELHDFSNYDEWVFLWGTDASGKEICFCAEKEVSNGATVELYGAYNVKVSY
ncbi:MAG: hypothetical protein LBJ64_10590 [Deltaproteobacteria bacterium]|nr:hypothetical protein [Deltaproteobacteria bacterium]